MEQDKQNYPVAGLEELKNRFRKNDDDDDVYDSSQCANCKREFRNDDDKFSTIVVDVTPDEEINSKNKDKRPTGGEQVENNKTGNAMNNVAVYEAIATVFGPNFGRGDLNEEKSGFCIKSSCSLCENCCKVLTLLYNTFIKFIRLSVNTSYLSKSIQLHRNTSANQQKVHDKTTTNEDRFQPPKKRGRKKKLSAAGANSTFSFVDCEVNVKETSLVLNYAANNDEIAANNVSEQQNQDDQEESNLEINEIKLVQQESNQNQDQEALPRRISSRTRKAKNQLDDLNVIFVSRRTRNDIKKDVEEATTQKPSEESEVSQSPVLISSSSVLRKNKSVTIAQLWEICSGGDLYFNETNLAKNVQGRYICPEEKCSKTFTGLNTLNRHSLSHDLSRTYNCSKCSKDFTSLQEIKQHLKTFHLKTGSGGVGTIKQILPRGKRRLPNSRSKTILPLKKQNFPRNVKSTQAMLAKEDSYKCKHCESQFLTEKSLEKHLTNAHQQAKAQGRCSICNQIFPSVLSLAKHFRSVHQNSDPNSKSSKSKDQTSHDKPPDKNSTEEIVESLLSANASHNNGSNNDEPHFGCSQCDQKFFQPKALRKHLLLHTVTNPLVCNECDKVFVRRDHLKRHKEMIHNNDLPKKPKKVKEKVSYQCADCDKEFTRKEYLQLHQRIHSGEKPFLCSTCGKSFRDPRNLAQHLISHNTDRPFCCSICGMTFKRAHHLNDHEGTHKNETVRPFICPVSSCAKSFKLRKHLGMNQNV